ncbi:hypothetical protein E3N88_29880 [Mikania micrantha]|uniref:RRM domain-containing protein n=1 Tax=Mikania micrantha TaxID=192012 RepID=A0A5N6MM71_9ASTR|nr:hypothetical protein E3N88_29880 [Mikania micrantha]
MDAYQPIRGSGSSLQFLNNPFGDTTYTKVFVGGLAWETHSETLHRYFEQFGEILEAVVITDKQTGRSKGYGFVTFRDAEAAKRACADPNPVIDGRRANCNLASLGRPQPPLSFATPPPTGFAQNASVAPAASTMAAVNKLVNKVVSFLNQTLSSFASSSPSVSGSDRTSPIPVNAAVVSEKEKT